MARNKVLVADLFSAALGLVFCGIAIVTPGFFINQNKRMSIFYFNYKETGSDSWSTKTYLVYDKEHDTNGLNQLSMIDAQLESLITVVLGGIGWLILLSNTMKKAPIPVMFLTGGIFLLVAVTLEFALLLRFIGMCMLIFLQSIWFPYSFVLVSVSFALHLYSVVVILIRYKRGSEEGNIDNQMTENPGWIGIHQDVITDNADVIADNRPEMMTYNDD
ncbi:uncharacterized protein LOC134275587 [Saccostrea cucullata]|uniref:uncharacterized protein LOC134275587 n=1 Tax=Saccostrea cuccullata TaxID=36930 RepID=UPI002ED560FE